MFERIAAVVVSYNRLHELKGGVDALRRQTRPLDQIIIVDNGSTDGTREWLNAQRDLCVIYQGNLGTSGAMRTGLNVVVEQEFDWGWCFDDDAHPEPGALQALCDAMAARPEARVFNSLGVSRTDPNRFAVGALWVRTAPDNYLDGQKIKTLAGLAPYIDPHGMVDSIGGHFYHGVLIHRSVVQKVGFPLPWLFICGEEIEYGLRIMREGYPILSVVGSRALHPDIPFATFHLMGKTKAFEIRDSQRRYYLIRNAMWIHRTYFLHHSLTAYAARRLSGAFLAELFVIPNKSWRERLDGCAAALRGMRDGLNMKPARDTNGAEILA